MQVFSQPIFQLVERKCSESWPDNGFITDEKIIKLPLYGDYPFSFFRLIWRTVYVIFSVVVAMIFPFFNDVLGLIGALTFFPLTVYFPIEMYKAQAKIRNHSAWGLTLNSLNFACLAVSVVAACGSVQGLAQSLKVYKPFKN